MNLSGRQNRSLIIPDKFLPNLAGTQGVRSNLAFESLNVTPDERYLFVQNSFLNLEGMSDGSITVIDLKNDKVVGNIETLKAAGFNPNCIMPLPNHFQKGGLRAHLH